MLLLSLRTWSIHRLLGRPGRRLQPWSGRCPRDKSTWHRSAWWAGVSSESLAMCPKTTFRRRHRLHQQKFKTYWYTECFSHHRSRTAGCRQDFVPHCNVKTFLRWWLMLFIWVLDHYNCAALFSLQIKTVVNRDLLTRLDSVANECFVVSGFDACLCSHSVFPLTLFSSYEYPVLFSDKKNLILGVYVIWHSLACIFSLQ